MECDELSTASKGIRFLAEWRWKRKERRCLREDRQQKYKRKAASMSHLLDRLARGLRKLLEEPEHPGLHDKDPARSVRTSNACNSDARAGDTLKNLK